MEMPVPEVAVDYSPTEVLAKIKPASEVEYERKKYHTPTSSRFVCECVEVQGSEAPEPPAEVPWVPYVIVGGGVFLAVVGAYFLLKKIWQ